LQVKNFPNEIIGKSCEKNDKQVKQKTNEVKVTHVQHLEGLVLNYNKSLHIDKVS